MTRSSRMRLALLLASFGLAIALSELAVRTLAPVFYAGKQPRFVAHPHLVYLGNPDHPAINSAGFGDIERSRTAAPGTARLAAIGGSTTFGLHNWPRHLEEHLATSADNRHVEVLNFGMEGYTTQESLINLSINILDYDPDALIIHHALNDLMPRLYPTPTSDYRHFRKAFAYNPHPFLRRSHLYLFLRARVLGEPSLANVTMTVNDANDDNLYSPDRLSGHGEVFARNLRTMISIAEGAGISVVLTTMPYSLDPKKLPAQWFIDHDTKLEGMAEHNRILREIADQYGLTLVDLDAEMTGIEQFFVDHVHCNDRGNHRKAELLATSPDLVSLLGKGDADQ